MQTVGSSPEAAGLAHVATVSFLASRASPAFGFWIALAGGVALARVGQRNGARLGYGASLAATLQTIALIGPIRLSIPLTQALSAPLIGSLEGRGKPVRLQVLACAAIRFTHVGLQGAFVIFVLAGGFDVYTKSYESLTGWTGFVPQGRSAVIVLTVLSLLVWTAFASIVQVLIYRRGLETWPSAPVVAGDPTPDPPDGVASRFDPRAIALSAALAFAWLIAGFSWAALGAVAAWLVIASLVGGGDRSVVGTGFLLALLLGVAVLVPTLLGGLGVDESVRRALRAVMLVLVATWLRAAAGAGGLREVSRRALGRLRRIPPTPEAAVLMDELGSGRQLGSAVRSLLTSVQKAPPRAMPVVDAVLGWVVGESRRFRPATPEPPRRLRARLRDAALVLAAAGCGLVLLV